MKIICISDTHEHFPELPEGDVLIHAGDATYIGDVISINKLNAWFGNIKHKYKHGIIFVAGNHDWLFQRDPGLAKSILTNAIYLQDSGVTIDGLNFYGSPWQPRFFDWAFNQNRGPDIKRFWDNIPDNTDVLITHGPPWGVGDATIKSGNVGCSDLLDAVRRVRPKLHVFGHIHGGYGEYDSLGTKFVNASVVDERYRLSNSPIVVDL